MGVVHLFLSLTCFQGMGETHTNVVSCTKKIIYKVSSEPEQSNWAYGINFGLYLEILINKLLEWGKKTRWRKAAIANLGMTLCSIFQ